jgi:hypothetical protein
MTPDAGRGGGGAAGTREERDADAPRHHDPGFVARFQTGNGRRVAAAVRPD